MPFTYIWKLSRGYSSTGNYLWRILLIICKVRHRSFKVDTFTRGLDGSLDSNSTVLSRARATDSSKDTGTLYEVQPRGLIQTMLAMAR